jgi:hypothetical protein
MAEPLVKRRALIKKHVLPGGVSGPWSSPPCDHITLNQCGNWTGIGAFHTEIDGPSKPSDGRAYIREGSLFRESSAGRLGV